MPDPRRGGPPPEYIRESIRRQPPKPETRVQEVEFDWKRGEIPDREIEITQACGSGPGGQSINTTESKAILRWNVGSSTSLSEDQKQTLRENAEAGVTTKDDIVIHCQGERSLRQNIKEAKRRLNERIRTALTPKVEREATSKPKRVKVKERRASEVDKRCKAGRGRVTNWE